MPAALLAAVLLAGACGGEAERGGPTSPGASRAAATGNPFPKTTASIATEHGRVRLEVELAETDEQRRQGLMHKRTLAPDAGMVFLFSRDVDRGFWMKDTPLPLSIAFYDRRGRIVRILDMKPCRADPCPVYYPGVRYRGALEVNRGAFRRWGVAEGDRFVLARR